MERSKKAPLESASEPQAQVANVTPAPDPGPAAIDRSELGLADLARAILGRTFKPRVGEIRRLAEGVLSGKSKTKKPKKDKKDAEKKGTEKKGAEKKLARKERKLSKIPGQKSVK